ncbi:DinB family protein [Hwanghaeella sp.]|uniref:DinB family protein n=1 Tax=Hwanghaeella sp. TaxID=2605943 RepID=UPI003CCC065E
MISADYVQKMAGYNAWQNRSLYLAADGLSDAERRRDRGAFFGSLHATLNHLLWADRIWMSRFSDLDPPPGGVETSPNCYPDWAAMLKARPELDSAIVDWSKSVDQDWLAGEMTWFFTISKKMSTKPTALVVVHFFNHQTHHRGQVHAMLTAAGARPEDTDLVMMPGDG